MLRLQTGKTFLLDGNHEVSQPLGDDPETGKSCGFETVQQDWLVYIFVNEQMATIEDGKS